MAFRKVTSFMPSVFSSSQNKSGTNENTTFAAKKATATSGASRRAALGDIGNTVPSNDNKAGKEELKKQGVTGLKGRLPLHQDTSLKGSSLAKVDNAPVTQTSAVTKITKAVEILPPSVEDIDIADEDNPQLVAEYVKEVYTYMLELERRHAVPDEYMAQTQKDITPLMRSILIDWMVGVHQRFKLLQETMYMTIDIMDRFLALQSVTRAKLQLVGITSMLIAAKYEETYPPMVHDMIFISDNAYSRAEVLAMESLILKKLDYNLGTPLPLHFLRRYSKAVGADGQVHTLAKYFMELKMLRYDMVKFTPSETACAAMLLSRQILRNKDWNAQLEYYSNYKEEQLKDCVKHMEAMIMESKTCDQQAVTKKYSSPKFMSISNLPELKAFISSHESLV